MRRQLYAGGGITSLQRQGYGLGDIVGDVLGKAGKVVKQIVKSDVGKAALLGLGAYGLGGGTFFGKGFPGMGQGFSMGNILPNIRNLGTAEKVALGTAAFMGIPDPTNDPEFRSLATRGKDLEPFLRRHYKAYNEANWEKGWTQDEEDEFVATYTNEYNQGGRVGLYAGGDPEDYPETGPEINIQDLIQEEGIQVGPQVKREGIKSLDAGAQSIKRTGNMETADSDLANEYQDYLDGAEPGKEMDFETWKKFHFSTAYYPGDVFSSDEVSRLFRDKSLTTNMDRKQLHKILMNPGMFPEAEEMLVDLLRQGNAYGGRVGLYAGTDPEDYPEAEDDVTPWELQQEEGVPIGPMADKYNPNDPMYKGINKKIVIEFIQEGIPLGYSSPQEYFEDFYGDIHMAQGGRIGAFNGGVMGGRVGLRALMDILDEEDEEEYAKGGIARLGYQWGGPGGKSPGTSASGGTRGGPGPGGQGARGQATQNPGRTTGTTGTGGYRNVHQTGAVTQTPGRRTAPTTGGQSPFAYTKPPTSPITGGLSPFAYTKTPISTTKTNLRNVPIRKPKKSIFKKLKTHFINNQKLADAVKKGLISTEEYNVLGGIDVNKTLGLGPVTTGITSAAYNAVQSLLGNQPVSDIAGDVSRNIYGSTLSDDTSYGRQYNEIMNSGIKDGGRVGAFGGGVMGIGTPGMGLPGIPQMASDGMEYDMRAGGFQNLGAKEGKDDVKANLAKNEFVMTADAVRGAGGGNIEVGAQKMYDTMKRLEGKVA